MDTCSKWGGIFFYKYPIHRVFVLFRRDFTLMSCLGFSSEFANHPIIRITIWCAVKWGVNDISIITICGETDRFKKGVYFEKNNRFFKLVCKKVINDITDSQIWYIFLSYVFKLPMKFGIDWNRYWHFIKSYEAFQK